MSKKRIIFIVIAVAVLAIVVGVFVAQKNSKIPAKQEQSQAQQQVGQNVQDDLVWYGIPEMNVRFKVDKKVANDLIYKYNKINDKIDGVLFSSNKLSQIPSCGVEDGSLGSLTRAKGVPADYGDKAFYMARKPKQFKDFFTFYEGPQAVCAFGENIDRWNRYFDENPEFKGWLGKAFDSVEILP